MPNRSHFWGNSAYFFKILNGIFLLEIEDGILVFILVIGVLIMFFLAMKYYCVEIFPDLFVLWYFYLRILCILGANLEN